MKHSSHTSSAGAFEPLDRKAKLELISESVAIADELLKSAIDTPAGLCWEVPGLEGGQTPKILRPADLYSGAAGVAWFLTQIGRHTHREVYLGAARKALSWAQEECRSGRVTELGFYSGAAGIGFAAAHLWQVTGEEACRALVLESAHNVSRGLAAGILQNDLLGGAAGIAVALIHIHEVLREDSLIGTIRDCRDMLLGGLRRGSVGCYWDRNVDQDRGLCGFAHGASGIGFALLEIGHYLHDEVLYWLAQEAFNYEDQFFDESEQNWPDFRVDLSAFDSTDESLRSSYGPGSPRFMNAWCHGAPGIGIARLRATELLHEPGAAASARAAVLKVLDSCLQATADASKFTLCHGFGGLAEMLLEAHRIFEDGDAMNAALSIGGKIIEQRRQIGRYLPGGVSHPDLPGDPSLMNGSAGIGCVLLRLAGGHHASILSPACYKHAPRAQETHCRVSRQDLARRFWSTLFPRTLSVAERLWPGQLGTLPPKWASAPVKTSQQCFQNFISARVSDLSSAQRICVDEALAFDLEIAGLDLSIESNFQLYSKRIAIIRSAPVLAEDPDLEARELLLNDGVILRNTQWDWSSASQAAWADNLLQEQRDHTVILVTSALGPQDHRITRFSYEILGFFGSPAKVEDGIRYVTQLLLDSKEEEELNIAKNAVIEQIKAAILAGFLVPSRTTGHGRRRDESNSQPDA